MWIIPPPRTARPACMPISPKTKTSAKCGKQRRSTSSMRRRSALEPATPAHTDTSAASTTCVARARASAAAAARAACRSARRVASICTSPQHTAPKHSTEPSACTARACTSRHAGPTSPAGTPGVGERLRAPASASPASASSRGSRASGRSENSWIILSSAPSSSAPAGWRARAA
eukprot:scaffold100019_cov80-Phaeocystis_antarctica.AAC.6